MTIYNDGVGNYFLGDCIYANHTINYPAIKYLKAHPHSSISAELTSLFTSSGLKYRNVLSQANFNLTTSLNKTLFAIAPISDSIDDRYTISVHQLLDYGSFALFNFNQSAMVMYNNSGYTDTANGPSGTNCILNYINVPGGLDNIVSTSTTSSAEIWGFTSNTTTWSQLSWCGVSDGESLGLFLYQYDFVANKIACRFLYQGIVDAVNTNNNYYDVDITTKTIFLSGGGTGSSGFATNITTAGATISGCHRIANSPKVLLKTGDAAYAFVCSDAQTPTATWMSDLYVFDNNATLGYPAIGKVRNIKAALGTYTIGKVVRIQGSVFPDAGSTAWIPVGTFGAFTLLMRCYTSVAYP